MRITSHEDSKYWYLTELAAKCTAKRMVPDYISAKIMRELKNGNVYTCMGCRSFLTVEEKQKQSGWYPTSSTAVLIRVLLPLTW